VTGGTGCVYVSDGTIGIRIGGMAMDMIAAPYFASRLFSIFIDEK
jgi:hypothetical protein